MQWSQFNIFVFYLVFFYVQKSRSTCPQLLEQSTQHGPINQHQLNTYINTTTATSFCVLNTTLPNTLINYYPNDLLPSTTQTFLPTSHQFPANTMTKSVEMTMNGCEHQTSIRGSSIQGENSMSSISGKWKIKTW